MNPESPPPPPASLPTSTQFAPTVTCDTCRACCCKLEVMLMGEDDIPRRFTRQDTWGGWVMHRLDDGWCAALDRATARCTIYERRPEICHDFAMGESDCLEERRRYRQAPFVTG